MSGWVKNVKEVVTPRFPCIIVITARCMAVCGPVKNYCSFRLILSFLKFRVLVVKRKVGENASGSKK